jgi:hypothetical protein
VQRGVARDIPLPGQLPGRLDGRKNGGRDSRDEHQNGEDSSHLLGPHLRQREVEEEALLAVARCLYHLSSYN